MWLIPKDYGDSMEPQQLGYINVVPACLDPGGVSKSPTFDSLSATLCKLNVMLKQKPLPGDILNAESVAQKFRQYGKWIDADRCHYREHTDLASSHLIIIRLYYQTGAVSSAQIGKFISSTSPTYKCHIKLEASTELFTNDLTTVLVVGFQDFTPKCQRIQRDHCQSLDVESFGRLLHRANEWMQQQRNITVLNLQSVNYKVKKKSGWLFIWLKAPLPSRNCILSFDLDLVPEFIEL